MADSTIGGRPAKPRPDFPLFPHASGRWCKKIRGKFHYFGKTADDPQGDAALAVWVEQKDDLLAGRTPSALRDGLTVRDLCNRFLTAKQHQRDTGELSPRSFDDYHGSCEIVLAAFGKSRLVEDLRVEDFDSLRQRLAKKYKTPATLGTRIQHVRTLFKHGYDAALIDKPVRFGPTFKRPAARVVRAHRQKKGAVDFAAGEIRTLLEGASDQLHAMILLGVNCGFGNRDCGTLPLSAVDLKTGWIAFPRSKTAVERRCPLWAETVKALRLAIETRRTPKDPAHSGLVFITKYGLPWSNDTPDSPIAKEFAKLATALKIHKHGRGFYGLRHTFQTVAEECRDIVAVAAIMGHIDTSMSAHYRERISDERLRAASDTVRAWLFASPKKPR